MGDGFSGRNDAVFIFSKKLLAADGNPTIPVPQNAREHQIAIDALDGTVGTAAITILPVGMAGELPLFEADGATPVVLDMLGDARSDIRGSLQALTATLSGFDGTEYKLSIASFF